MKEKPTYEALLREVEHLKGQLEGKKQLERELEYSQTLMLAAFDQSPVPMAVVTYPDFSFKIINKAAEDFLLIDSKDFLNKPPLEVQRTWLEFTPDGNPINDIADLPLPQTLRGIKTTNKEMHVKRCDGSWVWEMASASPVYNRAGELIGGILAMVDITDQKEHYAEVERQKSVLQELNGQFNKLNEKLKERYEDFEAQNEEYLQLNEELKQTNEELLFTKNCIQKSEERFRLMLNNSNDTFVLINQHGEQIFISDAAARDTGYSIDELKGPIKNVVYPPDLDIVMAAWEKTLNTKDEVIRVQYRHKHKHKEYIWYEASAQNHIDNPAINAVVVNVRDITNQKKAEEELILQTTFIEAIYNSIPGMLYLYDDKGQIVRWNRKHETMTGYNSKEMSHMHLMDWYKGDEKSQKAVLDGLKTTQEKGFGEAEANLQTKDGRRIPMYFTASPLTIFGKQYFVGLGIDITERKRVQEELEKTEALTRVTIENLPVIFYMIDNDGRFKLSIGAGLQSLGLLPNQVVGLSVYDLYKDYPSIIESVKQAQSGQLATFESTINGASHFNIVAPFVVSNAVNGIVGVALDITDRKRMEQEALKAKEKAEENDRLKTAFLQNMSHEIRTPMNAIMGFASLMAKSTNNSDKLEQYSKIIEGRCNDLLAIINDILDFSRIESGQSTLQVDDCDMKGLCHELTSFFSDYQNRTNKTSIRLTMNSSLPENEPLIRTDKLKLKQVLINLITNAFKFTEAGHIEVGCHAEGDKLLFHVTDTGVGIPMEKHEFIFERFARIDTVVSESYVGGTGLGLPIVKGLVSLLGGRVWFESAPGQGSTFFFTIDYRKAVDKKPQHEIASASSLPLWPERRVLVVEDDQYNAMYLEEVLVESFFLVDIATNGREAVKQATEQNFDLVLMDVRLPDISGYEATRKILNHKPGQIIIAQTAYAALDERQKALDAGCVDYVSKPTKREQLLGVIGKHIC